MKTYLIKFNNHQPIGVQTLRDKRAALNTAITASVYSLQVTHNKQITFKEQRKNILSITEVTENENN